MARTDLLLVHLDRDAVAVVVHAEHPALVDVDARVTIEDRAPHCRWR